MRLSDSGQASLLLGLGSTCPHQSLRGWEAHVNYLGPRVKTANLDYLSYLIYCWRAEVQQATYVA